MVGILGGVDDGDFSSLRFQIETVLEGSWMREKSDRRYDVSIAEASSTHLTLSSDG